MARAAIAGCVKVLLTDWRQILPGSGDLARRRVERCASKAPPDQLASASAAGVAGRSGGGFFVDEGGGATRATAPQPMVQRPSIDALLALQAVEDPLFAKKKAVRRGSALLDTLEAIKADLLLGPGERGRGSTS